MKRTLLALIVLFSAAVLRAEESKDWKGWYGNLLKGLKSKVQSRLESKTRVSSVAAVRGAKQSSNPGALYWKGGVSDEARKKLEAEKKQFADAVQLVMDGSVEEGRKAIEKFVKDSPDSVFAPDAREALSKLPPPQEQARPAVEEQSQAAGSDKPAGAKPEQEEKKK